MPGAFHFYIMQPGRAWRRTQLGFEPRSAQLETMSSQPPRYVAAPSRAHGKWVLGRSLDGRWESVPPYELLLGVLLALPVASLFQLWGFCLSHVITPQWP